MSVNLLLHFGCYIFVFMFSMKFVTFCIFIFILYTEIRMDLVTNNSQMMFENGMDHLSLDPGLPSIFAKSSQIHILIDVHHIVPNPGHSVLGLCIIWSYIGCINIFVI